MPSHGRRGLGTLLLTTVCEWAWSNGHAVITLSTFRDVPWNVPFYRKNGFRTWQPAEWTAGMARIREQEAGHGLRVEARVFMRRDLDGGGRIEASTLFDQRAARYSRRRRSGVCHCSARAGCSATSRRRSGDMCRSSIAR